MSDVCDNDKTTQRPSLAQTFAGALRTVMIAWGFAFVFVAAAIAIFAAEMLVTACVIAVASGLIAAAAMLPGLFSHHGGQCVGDRDAIEFPRLAMFGIANRFVGTVALFLLCRYQMAASAEIIAGLTIGWYVYLTVVEVVALVREMPSDGSRSIESSISLSADT